LVQEFQPGTCPDRARRRALLHPLTPAWATSSGGCRSRLSLYSARPSAPLHDRSYEDRVLARWAGREAPVRVFPGSQAYSGQTPWRSTVSTTRASPAPLDDGRERASVLSSSQDDVRGVTGTCFRARHRHRSALSNGARQTAAASLDDRRQRVRGPDHAEGWIGKQSSVRGAVVGEGRVSDGSLRASDPDGSSVGVLPPCRCGPRRSL